MSLVTGIVFLTLFVGIFLVLFYGSERRLKAFVLPEQYRAILQQYVPFYTHLYNDQKRAFEERMQQFLSQVRITGVKTEVEDVDRVLIAASAIIPIFGFKDWAYTNLHEVLLYPNAFDDDFRLSASEGVYGGMVGSGALQNTMVLSQQELRNGFLQATRPGNTGIHEFVHLIDKGDGATDGIPENIMDKQYVLPWLHLMQKEIQNIVHGQSDINPYGATNQAEFFAVVSEYFFQRPDLLKTKHPQLYELLEKIFRREA